MSSRPSIHSSWTLEPRGKGKVSLRLALDAHLSGRVIGRRLRELNHDVFALDGHPELEGLGDTDLLAFATSERRILITHNVQDFPEILRSWAEGGRDHTGCVIVVGIALDQFGMLLAAIGAALAQEPDQEAWLNRAAFAARS